MLTTLPRVSILLLLLSGCGDQMEIVPVEGRVTLEGEGWGRAGLIYFAPLEPAPGFPRMPGMGDVNQDGTYFATTQPDRIGLVPGKYRISVEIWEVPPTMGGPPSKSYVPNQYRSAATSGLELDIPADATGTIEFNVDIPKS